MKRPARPGTAEVALAERIRRIWETARTHAVRTVNTSHVCANWLIGQQIVEAEQAGARRATYGEQLLERLSTRLAKEFGSGFSAAGLRYMRLFYLGYPGLLPIHHAVRDESPPGRKGRRGSRIRHAVRDESSALAERTRQALQRPIREASAPWKPGGLHPGLSWTHYRTLLKVERREARDFYEIETVANGWSARQLERQVDSLLFERLSKSRDRKGLLALAKRGQLVSRPADAIKDPYVLEFLDLPASNRLVESELEAALISQLQSFLLELGSGFAFVARQARLTLDGDHFFADLVFYHTKLKCYVVIDLKVRKLSHADLGQMQLYVNYYDREVAGPGDNPTIGLILCTEKNAAVVRYVLGSAHERIFASRYKLHLPSEAELRHELRRELAELSTRPTPPVERGRGKA